jgi:hypothetical protein
MRRTIISALVCMILLICSTGATCRQETAQAVVGTFLNTLAENVAEQIVQAASTPSDVAQRAILGGEAGR